MFKDRNDVFYKKLWTMMVPIVLQNLMLALVAVADAFMLGGLDQNYMSAVSLATQIQFIQNMFLSAATKLFVTIYITAHKWRIPCIIISLTW